MPQPDTDSYGYCNNNTTAISDGHGYGNSDNNATAVPDGDSNCYGFAECDADALGDPASADAKAAAYALPSADALGDSRLKS